MMCNDSVYVIAEAGVNHNSSIKLAKELIDIAKCAGADAVKFQTFIAEEEISVFADKAEYQKRNTDQNESQLEMVRKLEFSQSEFRQIAAYCREKEIDFLSTPFDLKSLCFLLHDIQLQTIKFSSGDITTGPLLLEAARNGVNIILSTGMANLSEIEYALGIFAFGYLGLREVPSRELFYEAYYSDKGQKILQKKVTLLHCTTEYPASVESVNLQAMHTMRQAFCISTGLSDHTKGIAVAVAAAALGAIVIEKHFTLDKELPGPDHKASLEPDELKYLVKCIREVEVAIGNARKVPANTELKNISVARKSLVAKRTIQAGEVFSEDNITFKRPGDGICPNDYWSVLGKTAQKIFQRDEAISLYDL